METKTLKCVVATEESIRDYGVLISTNNKVSDFTSNEFKFWNRLGEMGLNETASVCVVESFRSESLSASIFERHHNTTETLIPTDDIFVVIALPGEDGNSEPDWDSVKAFRIVKGDAIILSSDVWHYAPMTQSESVKTFVVFNTNTPEKDNISVDVLELHDFKYQVEH